MKQYRKKSQEGLQDIGSYLDEDINRWAFPEMPPIANASNEEEVCSELIHLTDGSGYRESLEARCRPWYDKYHSEKVVLDRLRGIYRSVLESNR